MRLSRACAVPVLALASSLALSACEAPRHSCGTYPEGGGPALVRTRDGEFCELVRARFHRWLTQDDSVTHMSAEQVWLKSETWHREPTVDALIERIRKDAGEEIANQVSAAAQWIREKSTRPFSADCETEETCLVRRAAHGARISLEERDYIIVRRARDRLRASNPELATERPEEPVPPPSKYRMEMDDFDE